MICLFDNFLYNTRRKELSRGESIVGPSRDGATNGWIIGLLSTSDDGVETFDVTGVWHGVSEGDGMSIKVDGLVGVRVGGL